MNALRPYRALENLAECGPINIWPLTGLETLAHSVHILIAAAGQIDDQDLIALHLARNFQSVRNGMRGLQRRNNSFQR